MTTLSTLRRDERGSHETLESLASELARMQETKIDYVIDTRRASMSWAHADGNVADGTALLQFDTAEEPFGGPINDHAHGQIAARLGIPKRYYDRMRADHPQLLTANVNGWFTKQPERRMVRTLDGTVRAFVSDRYRRLDNFDLMERAVIPALRDHDGIRFLIANLTPERMVLRCLLPSVQREVGLQVGDIVQAGFQLRNSEVGATALAVEPFVWKLDCLNGMVSNVAAIRAYHIGRRITDDDLREDAKLTYAQDTIHADDKATFLKCRDAIRAALSETVLDEIVQQMRDAATGQEVVQPVVATEKLASTFALTETEGQSVLMSLARGGDMSRWGMVNAVTDAAKQAASFDRQEEMERLGGKLLTMTEMEWRPLAAAVSV